MNSKKLKKLRREIEEMIRSPQGRKSEDFSSIARQLGRKLSDRGKEPTYVREAGPKLMPPLSIPNHAGDMPTGTARSILDALLSDCDEWGLFLQSIDENDETED